MIGIFLISSVLAIVEIKLGDDLGENLGDTIVDSSQGNWNFGNEDEGGLYIINRDVQTSRYYIKFNISSIPADATIVFSNFSMYITDDNGFNSRDENISIYHVFEDNWNEGSEYESECGSACGINQNLTWNNQLCGINFDNSTACNLTKEETILIGGGTSSTFKTFNITRIIQSEKDLNEEIVSLVIKWENESKNTSTQYENYGIVSKTDRWNPVPLITITYTESEPESTPPSKRMSLRNSLFKLKGGHFLIR